MNSLFIIFVFLFYFDRNAAFCKYYYVKDGDVKEPDCSEEKPCKTISEALGKCSTYDTIYINGALQEENNQITISKTLTIKSLTEGNKVNIPVNKKESSLGSNFAAFYISSSCIMKDFKFTIGASEAKTPDYYVFYISNYLRLENAEFVRDSLKEGETLTPLPLPIMGTLSESSGSSSVSVYLHTCTFTGIELIEYPLVNSTGAAFYNCQFKNIKRDYGSGSVYEGGVSSLDIIDTTFDTCQCLHGDGGALSVSTSSPTIGGRYNNTIFKSCSAEYKNDEKQKNDEEEEEDKSHGGAFFLMFQEINDLYFNISHIEFGSGTEVNKADYGANIFFYASYIYRNFNSSYFPLLTSMPDTTDLYALYIPDEEEKLTFYPLSYLLNLTRIGKQEEVFVGGTDFENDCKKSTTPCPSVPDAVNIFRYGNYTINFVGDYDLEGFTLLRLSYLKNYDGNAKINVQSDGNIFLNFSSTLDGLIFILPESYHSASLINSYGTKLEMKSLSFKPKDGVSLSSFFSSVLSISSVLEMNNCSFSQINCTVSSNGIISITCENISINNCSFDSCSTTSKGGALYIDKSLSSTPKYPNNIYFSSTTFKKCSAKFGGAIYFDLDSSYYGENDGSIHHKFQFKFDKVTFGTGGDKNVADYGQNIFLESSHLNDLVSSKYFPMLKGLSYENSLESNVQLYSYAKYAYTYEGASNTIYNMYNFTKGDYFVNGLFVGESGDNSNSCKDKKNLCKTLYHALSLCDFNSSDVTIVGDYNLSEEVDVDLEGHVFHGDSKNTKINAREDAQLGVFEGTCKDFIINICSNFEGGDEEAFMFVYNLKLDNIRFTTDANKRLELSLLFVDSSVEMKSCAFTNITTDIYLIALDGSVKITDCTFTNIAASYSAIFANGGDDDYRNSNNNNKMNIIKRDDKKNNKWKSKKNDDDDEDESSSVYISGCKFTNISSDEESASGCFRGGISYSRINSTTFDTCTSSAEGIGGALGLYIGEHCYIGGEGSTVFRKCSSYIGGGFTLGVIGCPTFALKSLSFGTGDNANSATYGKNIAVSADIIESVADYDHFPTLKKESEEDNHLYEFLAGTSEKDGILVFENLIKLINGKLKKGPEMMYIGDEGTEGQDCTSSAKDKLCKTIDDVIDKVSYAIYNVTVVKSFTVSTTLTIAASRVVVIGENNETKIIPESYGCFQILCPCSFSSLVYEIDELNSHVFIVQLGTLSLYSSSFKSKNKLSFLTQSLIYVSNYGNLLIENCIIENQELLKFGNDKGCAIYVNTKRGSEIDIKGVSISNCKCVVGNGGGIYASIVNGSTFCIDSSSKQKTSFKNCVAGMNFYSYRIIWDELEGTESYGRGGAVYMEVESAPEKLKVKCDFGTKEGEMNEAGQGYDLFIVAENMKEIMNLDNFPCLDGKGSSYTGAMGIDLSAEDDEDSLISNLAKYAKDNDDGFPVWAIVLIVVLVVVVIVVIVVVVIVIVCVVKKRSGGDSEKKEEMSGDKNEPANSETNKE